MKEEEEKKGRGRAQHMPGLYNTSHLTVIAQFQRNAHRQEFQHEDARTGVIKPGVTGGFLTILDHIGKYFGCFPAVVSNGTRTNSQAQLQRAVSMGGEQELDEITESFEIIPRKPYEIMRQPNEKIDSRRTRISSNHAIRTTLNDHISNRFASTLLIVPQIIKDRVTQWTDDHQQVDSVQNIKKTVAREQTGTWSATLHPERKRMSTWLPDTHATKHYMRESMKIRVTRWRDWRPTPRLGARLMRPLSMPPGRANDTSRNKIIFQEGRGFFFRKPENRQSEMSKYRKPFFHLSMLGHLKRCRLDISFARNFRLHQILRTRSSQDDRKKTTIFVFEIQRQNRKSS